MNKNLLRLGGAISLLFVVFHLAMVNLIGAALAPLPPDVEAAVSPIVSTLNIHVAYTLLVFALLAIFLWRDLLTTRLGHIVAIAIALFWFLRAINQVLFYGATAAGMPLIGVCLVIGLLHLIPVLRERQSVTERAGSGAQPQADAHAERMVKTPWTSYAIVVWCVLFGGLHLYWALGGTAGFVEFSMPSNRPLALARDPLYMAITWGVVVACVAAAIVALAPFQAWSRRLPQWLLLTPLWIGCALFLVRGIGNPVQSALMVAGGMPFDPLPAGDVRAWNQWLLIDALVYSPWFALGGLAFGATARFARRYREALGGRLMVSAGQS